MKDQVRERHATERDAQVGHVGEVRLGRDAWLVDLWKEHLAVGAVLRPPGGHMGLQRAQLASLEAAGVAVLQPGEQRRALQSRVMLGLADHPRPDLGKWVRARAIGAGLLE